MYPHHMIFRLLLIMGMISFGCNSDNQNGKATVEDVNRVDISGIKQGPWEIYSDSVLISKGSFVNGQPDGLWTYWYNNGQMKEEGHYKNGLKKGMWVEWYRDGEIMWKGEWENDKRHIEHFGTNAEISFVGDDHKDHVLAVDSLYRLKIRVQNIPASNLFVEVSSGEITWDIDADLYILRTSRDTLFTMAIGYMPDMDFMDFRNLISEINFKLR
ncbi:MAG: hypothetical protein V2B15_21060 [Bacteroidota bacterium]